MEITEKTNYGKINYLPAEKAAFAKIVRKHQCIPIFSSTKRDLNTRKLKSSKWELVLDEYNASVGVKTKVKFLL